MIDTTALDVYDAAGLAGGPRRVVDTALAVLLESGRVRAQRSGELTVVDPRPRDEVEAAVLAAVGSLGARAATVRERAAEDERVGRVTGRLVREGLLSARWRRGAAPVRTMAGRQALRALRTQPPARGVVSGSSAVRVALHGPGGLPDPDVRAAAFGPPPRPPRRDRRRWSTGVYGGGGSGGCGGGGASCGSGGGGGAAEAAAVAGAAVADLGVGIGWRPEIDLTVERLAGVDFVEVVAESVCAGHLPESLRMLRARGVPVLPHGVDLSLGSAEPPDPARLARLAELALALDAPLVSVHIAFVRAGGREAGHLLPVPRTRDALEVAVANVRAAQAALPVPLAVENVAALFGWPDDELTDADFLAELVGRTGVRLGRPFHEERYGIGHRKGDTEFCRFLSATLAAAVADGRWRRAFEDTLGQVGVATPAPPAPDPC